MVPPRIEKGDAKGPQAAVLRVAVLIVAQERNELLHGLLLAVGQAVALRSQARILNEDVGVRGEACDGGKDLEGRGG